MATQWYYSGSNGQQGPVSSSELKALAENGSLAPTDLVWKEGLEDWIEATKVRGLISPAALKKARERARSQQRRGAAAPPALPPGRARNSFMEGDQLPAAVPIAEASSQVWQPAPQSSRGDTIVVSHPPVQKWSPGIAAVLSFFIPGLGQLYKGQILNGIAWFLFVLIGYAALIVPGLILHVFCIIGALSGNPWTEGRTEVRRT
jgi:TM2 domain-containing membrane protein YozV